jgi:hypothetical protein
MTVYELNAEQLHQVKESYLIQKRDEAGEPCYMSELADADNLIGNEEIYCEYDGINFSEDDFF